MKAKIVNQKLNEMTWYENIDVDQHKLDIERKLGEILQEFVESGVTFEELQEIIDSALNEIDWVQAGQM